MPNWAHNTLTVSGDEALLAAFVEKVKTDEQPLTFEAILPTPSDEVLREQEKYKPCTMCGGVGTLPETEEEAIERGSKWFDWMDPVVRLVEHGVEDRDCNVCHGTGLERIGMPGWWEWRNKHWGTKWDAGFDNPVLALCSEGADVECTKEAQGVTVIWTVAIYKFDTAWAPPIPVIEAASEQHPGLEFEIKFAEVGEGYAGRIKYVDGCALEHEELAVDDVLEPEERWF